MIRPPREIATNNAAVNMSGCIEDEGGLLTIAEIRAATEVMQRCERLGIEAVVVMPETVPADRIAFIEGCGARVELRNMLTLRKRVRELESEGYVFAHPFDDRQLFVGYGQIGIEILEDIPSCGAVIVPIGGGGLISGIAAAVKQLNPKCKVIGVEPEGAPSMHMSLQQGQAAHLDEITTFVNGLAPPFAGEETFQHVKEFVDEVVLVSDAEIEASLAKLYYEFHLVVEAASAASLAALLFNKIATESIKGDVCLLMCGSNISPEEMASVVKRGISAAQPPLDVS